MNVNINIKIIETNFFFVKKYLRSLSKIPNIRGIKKYIKTDFSEKLM